MKKILAILILVFYFCSPCYAGKLMGSGKKGGAEPNTELGNTSIGASEASYVTGDGRVTTITVPSGGRTITHGYFYGRDGGAGSATYEMGIYQTGGTQVGACSTVSGVFIVGVGNEIWNEVTFAAPIFLAAGTYRIEAYILASSVVVSYDTVAGGTEFFGTTTATCGTLDTPGSTRATSLTVANYNAH